MKNNSAKTIVKEYGNKFIGQNNQIDTFFTEFTIDNYYYKLPYLPENEIFNVRLLRSFINDEKICIYADFDTDAVTSTGVMYEGLIDLGFKKDNLKFYTPDRFKEGYGINLNAIKKLSEGFDLIITVDCGINSVIEAEYLSNKRCDLIITDHHLSGGIRPNCIAVCNPQMKNYYANQEYQTQILSIFENEINQLDIKYKKQLDSIKNRLVNAFDSNINFLSTSTTGVGVAWFCLVNFAYFLDEIGFTLD